jgi:hypothetical protein
MTAIQSCKLRSELPKETIVVRFDIADSAAWLRVFAATKRGRFAKNGRGRLTDEGVESDKGVESDEGIE